ncbi:hypothetical protein RDI58_018030 [Solanum bulbocastanum]|uniref:Uncharacterized protein n=1 Tax=Solanum bulbocastanum TaxID=147425 RepID=A0AAN8TCC5_SOLBU
MEEIIYDSTSLLVVLLRR